MGCILVDGIAMDDFRHLLVSFSDSVRRVICEEL